jgi:thiamine pyrophosphate-dependent acetolactate synthase large subunit-like protein
MKLYDAYSSALFDHGVESMFGLAGDGNLFMVNSYVGNKSVRYYAAAHEAGAVLMAAGFAQRTGKLGVATVTHGPALTNTVTALSDVVRCHVPLVLIVGDTPVADRFNLQDIDQQRVIAPSGAGFEQVRTPVSALLDLNIAMRRACAERRPIVLNVPVEFWREEVDYPKANLSLRADSGQATAPDPQALDVAVGVMASARRPIVLAGAGAIGARENLLDLADCLGAPVATTLRAKDLFAGTPWDLGIYGNLATITAQGVIAESDCIVAFGAGLNGRTTDQGRMLVNKTVIQVDDRATELGRQSRIDVAVLGDSGRTAACMIELLKQMDPPTSRFRSEVLAERLQAERESGRVEGPETGTSGYLESVLRRIDSRFPSPRSLAFDVGRHVPTALKVLHVDDPRAYIHTLAFGSIGLGMGYALGAAAAVPNQPVLFTVGDGGFMNGALTEFNTAVRHGLDVVTIVLNDGAYGAEHIQFRRLGMDPGVCLFDWPDFAPVAEALGGVGYTIRSLADLDTALDAIQSRDRPVLLDVKLSPDDIPSGG